MAKLSKALKDVRKEEGLTQQELGKILNLSPKWLSSVESSDEKASLKNMLHFIQYLGEGEDAALWLIGWLKKEIVAYQESDSTKKEIAAIRAEADKKAKGKKSKNNREEFLQRERMAHFEAHPRFVEDTLSKLDNLLSRLEQDKPLSSSQPSKRFLHNFPFYPLEIVVGDRRDAVGNRVTKATFLSEPAATTDLLHLAKLGLRRDVRITSHKLFSFMPEGRLRERFGKRNLLCLAAPQVNLGTLRVNSGALFRFVLTQEFEQQLKETAEALENVNDPEYLKIIYYLLDASEDVSKEKRIEPDYIEAARQKYNAGKPEKDQVSQGLVMILATVAQKMLLLKDMPKQAFVALEKVFDDRLVKLGREKLEPRRDRDFAVISIAKNPFSEPGDNFVAVMVAGFKGSGTAAALKFLSEPKNFEKRSLGGILEVSLDNEQDWPTRFEEATCKWITEEYDPVTRLEELRAVARRAAEEGEEQERNQLEQTIQFVEQLLRS